MAQNTIAEYLYWVALGIPLVLVIVGGFVDKLVSKEAIEWKHFYLGIDLTLSALATGLVNLIDIAKEPVIRPTMVAFTALFITVCVLFLIVLLSWHQDWTSATKDWKQIIRLGIASNIIGSGIIVLFVQLKLRKML